VIPASGFQNKMIYIFLIFTVCATYPAHLVFLYLITLMMIMMMMMMMMMMMIGKEST